MELVDYYLKIEKIRFQDHLTVEEQIATETHTALIPTLSVQPLVENAVRHGIAKNSGPGCIRICSRSEEGRLFISVENSANNFSIEKVNGNSGGIGIANIKSRLNRMYPASEFRISKSVLGGVHAFYSIPFEVNNTGEPHEEDQISYS